MCTLPSSLTVWYSFPSLKEQHNRISKWLWPTELGKWTTNHVWVYNYIVFIFWQTVVKAPKQKCDTSITLYMYNLLQHSPFLYIPFISEEINKSKFPLFCSSIVSLLQYVLMKFSIFFSFGCFHDCNNILFWFYSFMVGILVNNWCGNKCQALHTG